MMDWTALKAFLLLLVAWSGQSQATQLTSAQMGCLAESGFQIVGT